MTGTESTPSVAKARNISRNLHDSATEACASGASHSTRQRRPTLTFRVYESPGFARYPRGVSELAHRHGMRVHRHAHAAPHRHLVLPRASLVRLLRSDR